MATFSRGEDLSCRAELTRVGSLGLGGADLDCLRAVAIFPEDSLADVASVTLGYLLQRPLSDDAVRRLADALARAHGLPEVRTLSFDPAAAPATPILPPLDAAGVLSFRLDPFPIPARWLACLRRAGIERWRDVACLSERAVLERLGFSAETLHLICAIQALDEQVQALASDLADAVAPADYCSFEHLVDAYVSPATRSERKLTAVKGRLGVLDGRWWTLNELGVLLGVTRERIRQMALKPMKHLRRPERVGKLRLLWMAVDETLRQSGGICLAEELSERLCRRWAWPSAPTAEAMARLVSLNGSLDVELDLPYRVALPSYPCLECARVVDAVWRAVDSRGGLLGMADAPEAARSSCSQGCPSRVSIPEAFSRGFLLHTAERHGGVRTDGHALYGPAAWDMRYGTRVEAIEAILRRAGRAMSLAELGAELARLSAHDAPFSARYTENVIDCSPDVLLWDVRTYIHREHIAMPAELLQTIAADANQRLASGIPLLSIRGIHARYASELEKAGVPSDRALYTCLRQLAPDRLAFPKYPLVTLASLVEEGPLLPAGRLPVHRAKRIGSAAPSGEQASWPVLTEVAEFIRSKGRLCSRREILLQFAEELGHIPALLDEVCHGHEVVRFSSGTFIHLSALDWTPEKQRALEQSALDHYTARRAAGTPYGLVSSLCQDPSLPELPRDMPWYAALVADLLRRDNRFRILGTRHDAFVPVPNPDGVENTTDLLAAVLAREYGGAAEADRFAAAMREAGILRDRLTRVMLGDRLVILGDVVVLSEP